MSHIAKITSELVVEALDTLGGEDRRLLLRAYHAACLDATYPKSDELTQRIAAVAAGMDKKERTGAEISEPVLALSILLRQGINPFSGNGIATTAPVTDASMRIPDSYIGENVEGEEGLFAGYFDIGDGNGRAPLFVVELTKPMTFVQNVEATGKLENGFVSDPLTYDAKLGLREGKIVIAPFDVLDAARTNKERGKFAKIFKATGYVISSSFHPDDPGYVRIADFGDRRYDNWYYRGYNSAPRLRVRRGVNHLNIQ